MEIRLRRHPPKMRLRRQEQLMEASGTQTGRKITEEETGKGIPPNDGVGLQERAPEALACASRSLHVDSAAARDWLLMTALAGLESKPG